MRSRLFGVIIITVGAAVVFASCGFLDREPHSEAGEPTPTVISSTPSPVPSPTPELESTQPPVDPPTPTTIPEPTPSPVPTEKPMPTPTPVPIEPLEVTDSDCCGLFNWIAEDGLLVFDVDPGGSQGMWLVDPASGAREFMNHRYGISASSDKVAIPDAEQRILSIISRSGAEVGSIQNGGQAGWLAPDGETVAWLENLPVRTPSSTVDRAVELKVADVATGQVRPVLQLQTSEVQWLPDSRHLLLAARDLEFNQAGIWLLDTETGGYEILFEEIFLRAVRLSPDGEHVMFLRTFNEDQRANGVWLMNIQTSEMWRILDSGSVRWADDSSSIWLLDLKPRHETGGDRFVRLDAVTGETRNVVEIEGRVLNDIWEISPDGGFVAYWRESDGKVVVHPLN